ncbi:hypothetical protein TRFO_20833 [Tritrichomonas foetus]|uniref:Uncharacterized protein n=1 Tax=Tritrichomonas foetus TaxID=1144522 RepID=A0A1J4KK21_9EUKA|nr:hypothetical protein TRFO_20833 [Tritrichomonas foetus]|eukprot:OHT10030.1 hypothetical protein TRFO_20833 [Tritrichomonas foetus]
MNHPGIEPNIDSRSGMNVLDWAISAENCETVKAVLESHKFIRDPSGKEVSSVQLAISRGNPEVLKTLINEKMLRVNEIFENEITPLHLASIYDSVAIVEYLCQQSDVNVNSIDAGGRTPLHHAASEGFLEIVKILIKIPGIQLDIEDMDYVFFYIL